MSFKLPQTLFLFFSWIGISSFCEAQDWLWARSAGGQGGLELSSLSADSEGNTFVFGVFEGEFLFNGIPLSQFGEDDLYLIKLNAEGQILWANSAGSNDDDLAGSIKTLEGGSFAIGGRYWDSGQFGALSIQRTRGSNSALFVANYQPDGVAEWVNSIDGSGIKILEDLATDDFGHIYACGYFGDTLFVENDTLIAGSNTNSFLIKYDTSGNYIWSRITGTSLDVRGVSVDTDANGNIYLAGNFNGSLDFAGQTLNVPTVDNDVFLLKYDNAGQEIWGRRYGGGLEDQVSSIEVNPAGTVYLAGSFLGIFDVGGISLQTMGFNDNIYLAAVSAAGQTLWAKSLGGTDLEYAEAISVNGNEIAMAGYFRGDTDFQGQVLQADPVETDGFIAIFDQVGNLQVLEQIGGQGFDLATAIDHKPDASLVLGGFFEQSLQVGPFQLNSQGNFDAFVAGWGLLTSTMDPSTENEIRIFPNPLGQDLFFESSEGLVFPMEVQLFDAAGRLILSRRLSAPGIYLGDLEAGTYFLSGPSFITSFIKQ